MFDSSAAVGANKQNMPRHPSVPVAGWWCLVAAGIAACGVTLGDFPVTTSSALLLVMIILVPAAIMLVLWREAPEAVVTRQWFASHRDKNRRSRERPTSR